MADGKSDVNKADSYRAIAKEYMKKANIDESYLITVAHVDCEMDAQKLAAQLQNEFPNTKIQVIKLCNTVSAHTGLNCLAIQYFKQID